MNYEQDMRIDPDALDVEWLEQPRLMLKYTRILADARKELDQNKEKLDVIKAEFDKEIRMDPEAFEIIKITESVVFNTIITQEEYKVAFQKVIDCQYEVNMAQGAVRAMEQRKDALENLVRLNGQQYFAGPKVPRNLSKEWEENERQKRANQSVGSIKRTRRK